MATVAERVAENSRRDLEASPLYHVGRGAWQNVRGYGDLARMGRDLAAQAYRDPRGSVNALLEAGRNALAHPVDTARQFVQQGVQNELARAQQAASSPQALGEYAGSFIDPVSVLGRVTRAARPVMSEMTGARQAVDALEVPRPSSGMGQPPKPPSYQTYIEMYGLDKPQYEKILKDVELSAGIPGDSLAETDWVDAIRAHPEFQQARNSSQVSALQGKGRGGAAALTAALQERGFQVRTDTSNALGSKSSYVYASKDGHTVKIRLSDHDLPERYKSAEVGVEASVSVRPQNWKSALSRVEKIFKSDN